MTFQIQSTPHKQFPLRIDHNLHERFTHISTTTRIPKSTLGRLGITRLLNEIESKGITRVLQEMETE